MRRKNVGLGAFSVLFSAMIVAACSASGNSVGGPAPGSGAGGDSGSAGDSGYGTSSDSGTNPIGDSGAVKKDSGVSPVFDSGPVTPSADCDLSGAGLITAIPALQSGGDGACGAADACPTGDCCVNFASLFSGGGLPSAFTAIFSSGSPPTCIAQ